MRWHHGLRLAGQPAADLSGKLGRNGNVTPAKLSESPSDHTAWLFSAEDSEQLSGDEIASYLLSGLLTYDTTQNGCEILDTQARDYQVAELWMTNAAGLHEDGEDGPAADAVFGRAACYAAIGVHDGWIACAGRFRRESASCDVGGACACDDDCVVAAWHVCG